MKHLIAAIVLCATTLCAGAQTADRRCEILEWMMSDSLRRALVIAPDDKRSGSEAPLVFVFHGRRGTIERAMRKMHIHDMWKEAIVVYPQGLWSKGGKSGSGNGWTMPKADDCGRDIEFFDALLDTLLHKFRVDKNRIYCMGHSNGGGFVQGLWSVRGDIFAAVASVHSGTGRITESVLNMRSPKPVFFAAGSSDEIVSYDRAPDAVYSAVRLNGCDFDGREISGHLRLFRSPDGNDVAAYLHSGGHRFPDEVLPPIAEFFKSHPRKR